MRDESRVSSFGWIYSDSTLPSFLFFNSLFPRTYRFVSCSFVILQTAGLDSTHDSDEIAVPKGFILADPLHRFRFRFVVAVVLVERCHARAPRESLEEGCRLVGLKIDLQRRVGYCYYFS